MKIYIDDDFKCHVTDDGTMQEVETDFFDGKCDTFVEGYRFVPSGESWEREDGAVFCGEMVSPWKDSTELDNAQRAYEQQLLKELQENSIAIADLEEAYQKGVNSAYD